jgi:hypothetical protein
MSYPSPAFNLETRLAATTVSSEKLSDEGFDKDRRHQR